MNIISRALSLVVAIVYIVLAYYSDGGEVAFKVGMFLILPLACIFVGEFDRLCFDLENISSVLCL